MRFHKLRTSDRKLSVLREKLNNPDYLETAIIGIGMRAAESIGQDRIIKPKKKHMIRRFIK